MKKAKQYKPPSSGSKKFTKKRMYDTLDWVEYRNKFLAVNPFCYNCGGKARVVDHWQAHKGSEELFWKIDNFISLCKSCHDTVTNLFDRFNPPKTEEKLKWLNENRLRNDINFKIKVVNRVLKRSDIEDTDLGLA